MPDPSTGHKSTSSKMANNPSAFSNKHNSNRSQLSNLPPANPLRSVKRNEAATLPNSIPRLVQSTKKGVSSKISDARTTSLKSLEPITKAKDPSVASNSRRDDSREQSRVSQSRVSQSRVS